MGFDGYRKPLGLRYCNQVLIMLCPFFLDGASRTDKLLKLAWNEAILGLLFIEIDSLRESEY